MVASSAMAGLTRVCVFCGSSPGTDEAFTAAAIELGTLLAQRGIGLVYGGAHVGLMGSVADAALRAGGEVLGVIPESLVDREIAHEGVSELVVVADMHERKKAMYEVSDGFVALPGGYGTFEEVFEVTTWNQLGLHRDGRRKPLALLEVHGFWGPLAAFLDAAVAAGFVKPANRPLIGLATSPAEALEVLSAG